MIDIGMGRRIASMVYMNRHPAFAEGGGQTYGRQAASYTAVCG
jgi:hypothetical protein